MAAKLWETGTANAFSTTLNGTIAAGDATITLTTTSGLVFPGVLVIDRQDANDTNTPLLREYITYTGISSNNLTGCSRGVGGSSAQSHNSGARVEEVFSITHWNDLVDYLQVGHDVSGNLVTSTATITDARIIRHFNASGASITGSFPIHPVFVVDGAVSIATTAVGKPLPMPQGGLFSFFSAVLRTPASGASLVIDINYNGSSIFDTGTRLTIPGGGTFVSTASIATKAFSAGGLLSMDIDIGGGLGRDLTVIGRGN